MGKWGQVSQEPEVGLIVADDGFGIPPWNLSDSGSLYVGVEMGLLWKTEIFIRPLFFI